MTARFLSSEILTDRLGLDCERKGKEPVADFVYCHPNSALWLMQLFEMSWKAAKPGVNQHCQSATTASKRGRGAEIGRREGGCGVVKFCVCVCVCLWF